MSNFQYIDVDDERFEDAPRALREAYEKLKKAHQADATELVTLRSSVQQKTASDVLEAKGYNPKAAKFLLKDGIDLSDDKAVDAWLAEEGEFFKVEGSPASAQTDDHSDEAQQRARVAEATSVVEPASNDKLQAALAEITPDMTPDQVIAVYQKHGI